MCIKHVIITLTLMAALMLCGLAQAISLAGLTADDAVLVTDSQGDIVYQWQSERAMVPASTLKLLTALLALKRWGADYQFYTDFYIDHKTLWVKGYGDPYITSEELEKVALAIKALDLPIHMIAVDNTFFKSATMPEVSTASDPYNAPVSAVSANFNTVFVRKNGSEINSAEPQTPLTQVATNLAKPLPNGKHRVHARNQHNSAMNFAQLLKLKLGVNKEVGIAVTGDNIVPTSAKHIYRHLNSHTLSDVVKGTLFYSNNFIANQLFLMLAANGSVDSIGLVDAKQHIAQVLKETYQWQTFFIEDGSGLSRQNRLSAKQLEQVLVEFAKYQHLLKSYELDNGVLAQAKTGTLSDVKSFAGYLDVAGQKYHFVLLFNRPVAYGHRENVLNEIASKLLNKQSKSSRGVL